MRVLLAEDDMILAQSLTDRLEGQGFHFDEADVEARLSCLRSGADNYLTNPFNMEELVARLHALVRRANGHANNRLQFGNITLDLTARDVRVVDTRGELISKEYQMLELLCLRKGSVVSKESFRDHLYGGMTS
jgi:two-component system cell cycle response regulator CtrA